MITDRLAVHGGTPVRTAPWPQWPVWDETDRQRLNSVLESGQWGGYSPLVPEFEAEFASYVGVAKAVSGSNGSLTLEAILRAMGVGPGDEVIIPPYTFIATAFCVTQVGARPVFADIDPLTLNMCPDALQAAMTERTKAVIPVHFAGLPADMDAINAIAAEGGIAVIEDAAHAHGSTWNGRKVGALGTIASFSFQASKNMTAGEGGIVTSDDVELAERVWAACNLGRDPAGQWYEHRTAGTNYRMTAWSAAVLIGQLQRLDAQVERRMASARFLNAHLGDGLTPMNWDPRVDRHSFHIYCFRYDTEAFGGLSRDDFVVALNAEGVPNSRGYLMSLSDQPIFKRHDPNPCPGSDEVCDDIIWFKQNVLLGESRDMEDIVTAIERIRRSRT